MKLSTNLFQREHETTRVLKLYTIGINSNRRMHRAKIIRMGTKVDQSLTQGIELRLIFRTYPIRQCHVWIITKITKSLDNQLIGIPDIILFLQTIGIAYLSICITSTWYFQIVYPKITNMSLHNISSSKHEHTSKG